jgi:hypothetical protein
MRSPQIILWEADGWIARQLRELAQENRWLLRSVRTAGRVRQLLAPGQFCAICLIQFEPWAERSEAVELIAELHLRYPDVPVVAVSDVKLSEAERSAWTAALFDLGAYYVLFPPLTRPVLEDLVSGLMAATIRRWLSPTQSSPRETEPLPSRLQYKESFEPRRSEANDECDDLAHPNPKDTQ